MTAPRTLLFAAAIAAGVGLAARAAGDRPRSVPPSGRSARDERVAYVATLFDALRNTDADTLSNIDNYVYVVERNDCRSELLSLRVGCLIEASRRSCGPRRGIARDRCQLVSDVIVANRLSEEQFVPEDVRAQLMKRARDYRTEIRRDLLRRYAALVAELSMSRSFPGRRADDAALSAAVDAYCRKAPDAHGLSWQTCVAAIVWSIATEGATEGAERTPGPGPNP